MPLRPLKSFLPTADDVLRANLPTLGGIVLQHLKSYEGLNTVWQHGGLNRGYFLGMLENRNMDLGVMMPKEPEYEARQPEITEAVMGAWNWLVGQGILMPDHHQPGSEWFLISKQGEELLTMEATLEKLGLDRVKADLLSGTPQVIGGNAAYREKVWEWVRRKEGKSMNALKDNALDVSYFIDEVDSLLNNQPGTDSSARPWLGRAKDVIENWDASKYPEVKAGGDLFLANLHGIGKGAIERHRGLQQIVSLLTQAKLGLEKTKKPLTSSFEVKQPMSRNVFIVHGHEDAPREKVARFLTTAEFNPIILHEQASCGRTIIEKIEAHGNVGFAVVLLTPDDEGCKKGETLNQPRARQNVVLELGYFIGRLGRNRVCALKVGESLELPSDFGGVVYVPFDTTGGWRQALLQELEAAGFDINWKNAMAQRQ